ncbi:MAG: hypothetical protein Ta2B_02110 [Termitinemataceae bacterium]|nr:MAG: hypothetical protein Ta2B_02110 [Termitinemataceae bacterium]
MNPVGVHMAKSSSLIFVSFAFLFFASIVFTQCSKTNFPGDDDEPLSVAAQALKNELDEKFAVASGGTDISSPITINVSVSDSSAFDNNRDPLGILFDAIPYNRYVVYDLSGSSITELPSATENVAEIRKNKPFIVEIKLPSTLTTVGDYAFYKLSGITAVTIGDSVTSIGDYAFFKCEGLTEINLPASLKKLGAYALSRCTALQTVEIPNGVTEIPTGLLSGCEKITTLDLLGTVTSISDYAFSGCSEMIAAPAITNVTSMGRRVFAGCSKMTTITIPGVTVISEGLLSECTSLTAVNFTSPALITRIESYAFNNCKSLQTIIIPPNITSIADYAFAGCEELGNVSSQYAVPTQISIPNTVINIGEHAFANCITLYDISFGTSLQSIGDYAFSNCIKLGAYYRNPGPPPIDPYDETRISIHIELPNTVTEIGNYAFYGCENLSDFKLSDGTITIGDYAFADCSSLYKILASPDYHNNLNSTSHIAIPNSVKSIGIYAFRGCGGIGLLTISNNSELTEIKEGAFSGCVALRNVVLNNNITKIGRLAFANCKSMSLLLPAEPVGTRNGIHILKPALPIVALEASDAFNKIPLTTPLRIYVPSAMKPSYEASDNWEDYNGRAPDSGGTSYFEAE